MGRFRSSTLYHAMQHLWTVSKTLSLGRRGNRIAT